MVLYFLYKPELLLKATWRAEVVCLAFVKLPM